MIAYNPKDWFVFIFRFPKADTFRKLLPLMVAIVIYSAIVAYVEVEIFHFLEKKNTQNLTVIHSLLGVLISLLLVFRTNTAYDRWWEGRKLWGSLVNNSRNLALKLAPILTDEEDRQFFRTAIPSFAFALRDHLRNEQTRIELFDVDLNTKVKPDEDKHLPNQVAKTLFEKIHQLQEEKVLSDHQLLFINEELRSFTDICGACERIRNTPIPYSYSLFLKKFIFFYVMSLPITHVFSLSYYIIPIVPFIFYAMASLELIAEEIEEPFGHDSNDLPISRICDKIEIHIGEILD
jgi:ion channel-forming bestrophin family protein